MPTGFKKGAGLVGELTPKRRDRGPVLFHHGFGPELLAVEDEHRKGRAAAELFGELAVAAGDGRPADVGDTLVVERPADLLVVVRDLEVVEDGRLGHCSEAARIASITRLTSRHGSGPGSRPPATVASRSR